MADVIPTTQNLPADFCPETYQEELEGFADAMRVNLPDSLGQVIIQQNAPGPENNNYAKIWFKVDANNKILGIYSYSSLVGDWVLADDFPYYFQDTGVADAIAITTGENIALNVDLQGRFFFVRIAATNLTTAPTFQVDIAPVTAIKKYGSTAIAAGDFAQDMIAILLYDGTQFQFLNPVIQIPAAVLGQVFASGEIAIGTAGTTGTPLAHGFGTYPTIVSAFLRCVTDDATVGVTAAHQFPLYNFITHFVSGNQDESGPIVALQADVTNITPFWNWNGSSNAILFKTVGSTGWTQIDETKWKLVYTAYA